MLLFKDNITLTHNHLMYAVCVELIVSVLRASKVQYLRHRVLKHSHLSALLDLLDTILTNQSCTRATLSFEWYHTCSSKWFNYYTIVTK